MSSRRPKHSHRSKRQKIEPSTITEFTDRYSFALCLVLNYVDLDSRYYNIRHHKNTFMLNKYIYKRFKETIPLDRLAYIDYGKVTLSNGYQLMLGNYINTKKQPILTVIDNMIKIEFSNGTISRIYADKSIKHTSHKHAMCIPGVNGEYIINEVNTFVMSYNDMKYNIGNILESSGLHSCFGYFIYGKTFRVGRNMFCIGIEEFDISILRAIDKIYILQVKCTHSEYGICKIITRTYISYDFKIKDLITGSKYYLNKNMGLYAVRLNNTDRMMFNGALEIDEFLPFEYVNRVRLANGKILLAEADHNGTVRFLPA